MIGLKLQVWDVPAAWSLKDAATVPVAYLTAYYSLLMRAGLRKGQSVLVHSGTGAVGLAAIRIAHFRGCEARPGCNLLLTCGCILAWGCVCTDHHCHHYLRGLRAISEKMSWQYGANVMGSENSVNMRLVTRKGLHLVPQRGLAAALAPACTCWLR